MKGSQPKVMKKNNQKSTGALKVSSATFFRKCFRTGFRKNDREVFGFFLDFFAVGNSCNRIIYTGIYLRHKHKLTCSRFLGTRFSGSLPPALPPDSIINHSMHTCQEVHQQYIYIYNLKKGEQNYKMKCIKKKKRKE